MEIEADPDEILHPAEVDSHVNGLHYASAMGDKKGLQDALAQEDVNVVDVYGRTALVYAVVGDKMSCVELLIKNQVDVNAVDNEGRTALHWACFHNRPRMTKLLLACGADLHAKDNEARTCLHHACTSKSSKCFTIVHKALQDDKLLLSVDQWGMTCVHWACQAGALDILKYILGKVHVPFLVVDYSGKLPFHWACGGENHKTIQYLVSMLKGGKLLSEDNHTVPLASINSQDDDGRTSLHVAVGSGNTKVVTQLLQCPQLQFTVQDVDGRTPLHWAAQMENKAIVSLLLQKGGPAQFFSFDKQGVSALHYAVHEGNAATATAILRHADIIDVADQSGRTGFMVSAIKGNTEAARALVATGKVDIHARDAEGNTALHMASYFGFSEYVAFLIEKGCSGDDYDDRNVSALFHATEGGHTKCVQVLVQNGANVNFRDSEGRTLLHWAAISGHHEILDVLLSESKIDVDSTDRELRTPLHNSIFVENEECAKVLLAHNANVNEQDNMGIAALHWAVSKENMNICKLLISHGANASITEFHEDRFTPVDYAIMQENKEIEEYLRENGGKAVEELKNESARYLQSWWIGHRARISLLGLLKNHLKEKVRAKEEVAPFNEFSGHRPTKNGEDAGFAFTHSEPPVAHESAQHINPLNDGLKRMVNRKESMLLPSIATNKTKKKERKKVTGNVVPLPPINKSNSSPREKKGRRASHLTRPVLSNNANDVDHTEDTTEYQHEATTARNVQPQHHGGVQVFQTSSQRKVKGERTRVAGIRQKIDAARVIQRAIRRWLQYVHDNPNHRQQQHAQKGANGNPRGRYKPNALPFGGVKNTRRYEGKINIEIDPENKEQQVSALTIQLAWRQYLTEKTQREAQENSPRTRSGQQAAVYLSEVPVFQWKPTLAPTVRPVEFRAIPSAAITSYNMALSTYTKPFAEIQKQRFQKAQSVLAQREKDAQKRLLETEHKLRSLASLSMRPRTAADYDMTRSTSFDPESTQTLQRHTSNRNQLEVQPEEPENFYAQYADEMEYEDDEDEEEEMDRYNNGKTNGQFVHKDEEDFERFKAQLQEQHRQKQPLGERKKVDPYAIMKSYNSQRKRNDSTSSSNFGTPKRKPHAGVKLPSLSTA
eukprot:m.195543 g.195543  ORF g.195543 m.195543 type:complete len:1119 (-) comp13668_c0_seq6:1070-4426(-)